MSALLTSRHQGVNSVTQRWGASLLDTCPSANLSFIIIIIALHFGEEKSLFINYQLFSLQHLINKKQWKFFSCENGARATNLHTRAANFHTTPPVFFFFFFTYPG